MLFYQVPAASLKCRRWGLGIPMHLKMSFILSNIDQYILLVLNMILYADYIALAIDPFLGPCYCLSIAYRLHLMSIFSATTEMHPSPCPGPKKSTVQDPGPGPGPYPLWLIIWASRESNRQSIGSRQAKARASEGINRIQQQVQYN